MFDNRSQSSGRPAHRRPGGARGFTLTELLVVIVIIGIILSYILNASLNGVALARQQATQSLIQKLDAAMSERMEALLSVSVSPNASHIALARSYSQNDPSGTLGEDRARVIALYDFIKSEVPDVFFRSGDANYPLNFAAQPFPGNRDGRSAYTVAYGRYMLPLGTGVLNNPSVPSLGAFDPSYPNGIGIFGASYAAAAGIYKNLGYNPKGYDGIDNDDDGFVDESDEGVDDSNRELVVGNLGRHTHKTARSEMLYAVLVEGMGPLGAAFAPDDFTTSEVRDTDGDGLPEFVDAWGEPLQFYRWPIFYHSDIQRGFPSLDTVGPYSTLLDHREQDSIDTNQQLVSPAWSLTGENIANSQFKNFFNRDPSNIMSGFGNPADPRISRGAWAFQRFFHTLVEPLKGLQTVPAAGTLWDRASPTGIFADYQLRRSYFTKFLILSAGPDLVPGVGQLGFNYRLTGEISDNSGAAVPINAANVLQIENTAAAIDPNQWDSSTGLPLVNPDTTSTQNAANGTTLYLQQNAGLDDVTNHNGQIAGGSTP